MKCTITLKDYFQDWIEMYKKPLLAVATYKKYENTAKHIKKLFGDINITKLDPTIYQKAINIFAETHAKATVTCLHKQIHACLLDAIDEGIITKDPSRKAIITGRFKPTSKEKYLHYSDWKTLVNHTYMSSNIMDQVIFLAAMTGLRYAEVLGLTWDNVNYEKGLLTINKTWDYKYHQGFLGTKNKSSERVIDIDRNTVFMLRSLQEYVSHDNPNNLMFHYTSGKELFSTTTNKHLVSLCHDANIPIITFHSIRHTHASILLFQGVSILAVSKRLGHSNVTTTQEIYLHIIKEMQERERESILHTMEEALYRSLDK